MTPLSEEILKNWQVRKTRARKTAFIEFMQAQLPQLQVEKSALGRNLVLGDVKSAKMILTAHYDTCARLPFPNFITPKNFFVYLGYQLLIALPFLAVFFLCLWGLPRLGMDFMLSYWLGFLAMMGGMVGMFMLGPANRHTANDNTSGVVQLCELYAAMTQEQRAEVCFVFFDNEENGLLGSTAFASRHKADGVNEKPLLNFDCVSDGDHLMIVLSKKAMQKYGDAFRESYVSGDGKTVLVESAGKAFYPSDQTNFKLGVGYAALKKHKLVGYYMDRIHTERDTVFQAENIRFLTDGTLALLQKI